MLVRLVNPVSYINFILRKTLINIKVNSYHTVNLFCKITKKRKVIIDIVRDKNIITQIGQTYVHGTGIKIEYNQLHIIDCFVNKIFIIVSSKLFTKLMDKTERIIHQICKQTCIFFKNQLLPYIHTWVHIIEVYIFSFYSSWYCLSLLCDYL